MVAHQSLSRKNYGYNKNNFSQLEPYNENIISGEDDIGERLTANAEGTE